MGMREWKRNWTQHLSVWHPDSSICLILPPALKRCGPPRRQGLCSHLAHLWATSDSALRPEAVVTPRVAGIMLLPCPRVGHF